MAECHVRLRTLIYKRRRRPVEIGGLYAISRNITTKEGRARERQRERSIFYYFDEKKCETTPVF